jgi:hypothetical protein
VETVVRLRMARVTVKVDGSCHRWSPRFASADATSADRQAECFVQFTHDPIQHGSMVCSDVFTEFISTNTFCFDASVVYQATFLSDPVASVKPA